MKMLRLILRAAATVTLSSVLALVVLATIANAQDFLPNPNYYRVDADDSMLHLHGLKVSAGGGEVYGGVIFWRGIAIHSQHIYGRGGLYFHTHHAPARELPRELVGLWLEPETVQLHLREFVQDLGARRGDFRLLREMRGDGRMGTLVLFDGVNHHCYLLSVALTSSPRKRHPDTFYNLYDCTGSRSPDDMAYFFENIELDYTP